MQSMKMRRSVAHAFSSIRSELGFGNTIEPEAPIVAIGCGAWADWGVLMQVENTTRKKPSSLNSPRPS